MIGKARMHLTTIAAIQVVSTFQAHFWFQITPRKCPNNFEHDCRVFQSGDESHLHVNHMQKEDSGAVHRTQNTQRGKIQIKIENQCYDMKKRCRKYGPKTGHSSFIPIMIAVYTRYKYLYAFRPYSIYFVFNSRREFLKPQHLFLYWKVLLKNSHKVIRCGDILFCTRCGISR